MVNVFVDDIRKEPKGYVCLRSGEEFMRYLDENPTVQIDKLHLDHDLGEGVMDGYDIVKKLYQHYSHLRINQVRLHTDNHVGFENMYYFVVNAIKNGALPNVKHVSPYVYDVNDGNVHRGLKVH